MAYNFRKEFLCPGGALYYLWNLVFKSSIPPNQISRINIEERVDYIISRILDGEPEHLPQVKWRAFNFMVCSELLHGLVLLYQKKTYILIRDSASGYVISCPRTIEIHTGIGKRLVSARDSRNPHPVYFEEASDDEDHKYLKRKRRRLTKKDPKKGRSLEQRKSIETIQRSQDQDRVQLPELEFHVVEQFSEDIGTQREERGAAGIDRNLMSDTEPKGVREQMARLDIPEQEFGPTNVDELLDIYERNYQEGVKFISPLIAPERGEVTASTSHIQESSTPYQDYEQIQISNVREFQDSPELSVLFQEMELEDLEEPVRILSKRQRMRRPLRDEETSIPLSEIQRNIERFRLSKPVEPLSKIFDLRMAKRGKAQELLTQVQRKPITSCLRTLIERHYTTSEEIPDTTIMRNDMTRSYHFSGCNVPLLSTNVREHSAMIVEIPNEEGQMVPQFISPVDTPAAQHVPQHVIHQSFDSCVIFPNQGDHGQNIPRITRRIAAIEYADEQAPQRTASSEGQRRIQFHVRNQELYEVLNRKVAYYFENHGSFPFDLLCSDSDTSRREAAEVFSTLLEMAALGEIRLSQEPYASRTGSRRISPIYIHKF